MYFNNTKHKVFISYYHHDDQHYKNDFVLRTSNSFIHKSVMPGDINTDVSDQYIKRLIQSDFLKICPHLKL